MIRVGMREEPSFSQIMPELSAPPEPEFESAIPGLDVLKPEPDPTLLRFQTAADVAADLQGWKAAEESWRKDYMAGKSGPEARNAAEEARAFNEERFQQLRQKYAQDSNAMQYLREEGSLISSRGIAHMKVYAGQESARYVESVLAEEERELRALAASPWSTEQRTKQAFDLYVSKVTEWRRARGESPEALKVWKKDFGREVASEALQVHFERILTRDPEQALKLIRTARGEERGSGGTDAGGIPAGEASSSVPDGGAAPQSEPERERQAKLLKKAFEYSQILTAQELQVMQNRAEAEKQSRLRWIEELAGTARAEAEATALRAVEGGDLSSLRGLEEDLTALGRPEDAGSVAALRESMTLLRPYLVSSRFEPFARQREGLAEFMARPEMRSCGSAAVEKARTIAEQGLAARQDRFLRDPAGYVALHPLIGLEGMSEEEFGRLEHISREEHITRSLRLQQQLYRGLVQGPVQGLGQGNGLEKGQEKGLGMGVTPRVLTQARAAEIKDQYDGLEDPRKKAEFLRQLLAGCGKYAPGLAAEAGLPMAATVFAEVLPELSLSESAKLVQASGLFLESMDLPEERKKEIRRQVAGSGLVKALLIMDGALYGAAVPAEPTESAGPARAAEGGDTRGESGNPGSSAREAVRALESFAALGGNLPDLERRVLSANTRYAEELMAEAAKTARDARDPYAQPAETPRRSAPEQWAHSLGVGTRGVVNGFTATLDGVASPARLLMNLANGLCGGDPDFFKPIGETVSNAMNLPRPENRWEEIACAVNKGGAESLFLFSAAKSMLAKGLAEGRPILQSLLNSFGSAPGAQVFSGVGAETAVTLARQAGLGPVGTLLAGLGGSLATPSSTVISRAKTAATLEDAARAGAKGAGAEGAVQAETKAAAGEVKSQRKDFTDFRTDADMQALHQQLKNIQPKPEDFLYTPQKEVIADSVHTMKRLSQNLEKDIDVIATPVEISPGQWKLRVDKVPPAPSLPETRKNLQDMYAAMLRGEQRKVSLGIIGPEEAAKIKAKTGVDTLLCKRELDTEWIDHAFKRHGNEMTTGQKPITEQDFIRYGEIMLDPHDIVPGGIRNSIRYVRRYPDGTIYTQEMLIKGKKLEFRSLWKQAAGGPMVMVLAAVLQEENDS